MMVPNIPDQTQLAEVIQSMVRDAGFELKINPVEFAASLPPASQGNFETYMIGWSGRPDADGNLYVLPALRDGPELTATTPIRSSTPPSTPPAPSPTRPLAWPSTAKMMDQVRKDMPIIYLYHPVNIVGLSAKLTGFRPVPDGLIRLQGLAAAK